MWEIKIVSTILLTFRFRNAILHVIDIYLAEEVMKGVAYSFPCLAYLYLYLSLYTLELFQVTKGQPKFHVLLLWHSALGLAWALLIFHSAPEYRS